MNHANLADLKEIYGEFQKRKDIFPFKRQDKLKREIAAGQVVWQDGVVIVWQKYKKRTRVGDVQIPAGSVMLHQILNSRQFSGKGGKVFERFVEEIVRPPRAATCTCRCERKMPWPAHSTSATA